ASLVQWQPSILRSLPILNSLTVYRDVAIIQTFSELVVLTAMHTRRSDGCGSRRKLSGGLRGRHAICSHALICCSGTPPAPVLCGAGGQTLGRHGFSKGHRPDLR